MTLEQHQRNLEEARATVAPRSAIERRDVREHAARDVELERMRADTTGGNWRETPIQGCEAGWLEREAERMRSSEWWKRDDPFDRLQKKPAATTLVGIRE